MLNISSSSSLSTSNSNVQNKFLFCPTLHQPPFFHIRRLETHGVFQASSIPGIPSDKFFNYLAKASPTHSSFPSHCCYPAQIQPFLILTRTTSVAYLSMFNPSPIMPTLIFLKQCSDHIIFFDQNLKKSLV